MIIPKRLAHLKTMAISPLGFPKKCEKPVIPHYIFFPCTSKHALFPEKKITRYLLLYILIFFPFNSTLWKYVPTDVVGHTCRRTGQKTQTAPPAPLHAYSRTNHYISDSLSEPYFVGHKMWSRKSELSVHTHLTDSLCQGAGDRPF